MKIRDNAWRARIDTLIDAGKDVYDPGNSVVFRHPLICKPDAPHESFLFGSIIDDNGTDDVQVAYLRMVDDEPVRCGVSVPRQMVKLCLADSCFDTLTYNR